jgi:hypothetical protein
MTSYGLLGTYILSDAYSTMTSSATTGPDPKAPEAVPEAAPEAGPWDDNTRRKFETYAGPPCRDLASPLNKD